MFCWCRLFAYDTYILSANFHVTILFVMLVSFSHMLLETTCLFKAFVAELVFQTSRADFVARVYLLIFILRNIFLQRHGCPWNAVVRWQASDILTLQINREFKDSIRVRELRVSLCTIFLWQEFPSILSEAHSRETIVIISNRLCRRVTWSLLGANFLL